MLVAVLLGWVTTKKSGTTFAMITLGVGELVWAMSLMFPEFFGGEGGVFERDERVEIGEPGRPDLHRHAGGDALAASAHATLQG